MTTGRDAAVIFCKLTRTRREHVMATEFGMPNANGATNVEMMTYIRESHLVMPFIEYMAKEQDGLHDD